MPDKCHSAVYRPGHVPGHDDGRMLSPTFPRNHEPVALALQARMGVVPGAALEVGSGTGQHVQAFARALPHLRWHPSDPDAIHRVSIDAWTAAEQTGLPAARALDASDNFAADVADLEPLRLIFSMNVIHIAPIDVAEAIISTAARSLCPGGWLGFYGPFREGGIHTAPSNAAFDVALRDDNPAWGVRDVDDLALMARNGGLSAPELDIMPANNRILWFQRPLTTTGPKFGPNPSA